MAKRLSIVKGASIGVDNEGNEISLLSGHDDYISAEDIPGDNERSIIRSIDKQLKKERKEKKNITIGKVSSDLSDTLGQEVPEDEFDAYLHQTYGRKYPELFENGVLKQHLFDEKNLSLLKSKKSTQGQIRDILIKSRNS